MLINIDDLLFETALMKQDSNNDIQTIEKIETVADGLTHYASLPSKWIVLRKHERSNQLDLLCLTCGEESVCDGDIYTSCPWCRALCDPENIELDERYEVLDD